MLDLPFHLRRTRSLVRAIMRRLSFGAYQGRPAFRTMIDVGIVYTERGSYVLALFYNGNAADEEEYARNEKGRIGDDLLAELSRDIYLCAVGGGGGRP